MPAETIISYWKPEVAIRLVTDSTAFPFDNGTILCILVFVCCWNSCTLCYATVPYALQRHIYQERKQQFYKPPIHVDEIGLTSDKYIPLNSTVSSLPLKLSFGSMSFARWMLMQHMEESISSQKAFGFTDKDTDDVRRLISDTSVYLLGITILASLLHLVFEFLAFQSDIQFWRDNKSLAGLSTRALVTDLLSQSVVFLFLVESDSSLLVTVPSFFGILIQGWKVGWRLLLLLSLLWLAF